MYKGSHTWAAMNCLSPSTVIPLRRTPLTVGNRGSSLGGKGKHHLYYTTNLKNISDDTIQSTHTSIMSLYYRRFDSSDKVLWNAHQPST